MSFKSSKLAISVVIPTYNRRTLLERCLTSVLSQKLPREKFEVIVVNDGSTDDTKAFLDQMKRRYKTKLKVINLERNRGSAVAKNIGIKIAKGSIVVFTNDDCIVKKNWLKKLLNVYRKHPGIVGAGGYADPPEEEVKKNIIARYEKIHVRFVLGDITREYVGSYESPAGGTANMSYKKRVLEEVGYFDEVFPRAAYEDVDLKARICKLGYKIAFIPEPVTHLHGYFLKNFVNQRFGWGIGSFFFKQKHLSPRRYAPLALPFVFLYRVIETLTSGTIFSARYRKIYGIGWKDILATIHLRLLENFCLASGAFYAYIKFGKSRFAS